MAAGHRSPNKNNLCNQKKFDSHRVMLYKGSGTSIVLGNPEQGSDRFKGNTRRWPRSVAGLAVTINN
jgi:hypothetical protein